MTQPTTNPSAPTTRHLITRFIILSWLLALLLGCAPVQLGRETPAGEEPITVQLMVSGGPVDQAIYQAVVDAFHAQAVQVAGAPVRVELVGIPSPSDFMTRLTTDFAAGTPPDVFLLNYRRLTQFYNRGAVEPLGPWLAGSQSLQEADFYPVALDAFRDGQGTLTCLPQNISSQVVYYNKQVFDEAGEPYPSGDWTWEEFRQTAIRLTSPDGNGDGYPDRYGLGLEPALIRMAPWIWQNGGELVDDPAHPTRLSLDAPATRAAIQFVINLAQQDGVVPNYSAEAIASQPDRFLAGNIAMYIDSRAFTPTLRETVKFAWDVAALPHGQQTANVLHSDGYCMAASSQQKAAAWALIEFALSAEGQTIAAQLGRTVPSMRKVAESPAFLNPDQPPANSQVWLDAVDHLRILPKTENWPAIERTAATELEQAYMGFQSLDTLIHNIQVASESGFVAIGEEEEINQTQD